MKKVLRIFAVGILAMALLTACGNGENEVEKTTFAGSYDGDYITITHAADTVSKIVIGGEESIDEISFNKGETVEDRYRTRKGILRKLGIDLDYEIGTDSVFSEFIIDTSRVTKDTIEQVWGNGVFVYNSDGTMSYSKTAENLQDNGYEKQ